MNITYLRTNNFKIYDYDVEDDFNISIWLSLY